jgi:phosphoribosylanthranilate isomerase
MTVVKICGLRDAAATEAAVKGGADLIGIVFAESRRRVTPEDCAEVVRVVIEGRRNEGPPRVEGPTPGEVRPSKLPGAWAEAIEDTAWRWRPLIVGVFADQDVDEVNAYAEAARLDLVQLSGDEQPAFVAKVTKPVIKTLHVGPETTVEEIVERAAAYRCAGFHLDKAKAGMRGGTGEAFDWALAAEVARHFPFLLAGGLTPENVAGAIEQVNPWGVDVSSGVETDGVKDPERVRAFLRAAKRAAG